MKLSIIDALLKKHKHPLLAIHSLTKSSDKYSPSVISHMIKSILKKYPLIKYGPISVAKTRKVNSEVKHVTPPQPIANHKTRKSKSFFSKLFI
jgi:hypothetical protein